MFQQIHLQLFSLGYLNEDNKNVLASQFFYPKFKKTKTTKSTISLSNTKMIISEHLHMNNEVLNIYIIHLEKSFNITFFPNKTNVIFTEGMSEVIKEEAGYHM